MAKLPETLTTSVPHGNPGPRRCAMAVATASRKIEPIAPPKPTDAIAARFTAPALRWAAARPNSAER